MFEKKQFPTLQSLALDVVGRNYHLYPQLTGLSERVKEVIIEKSIECCGQDEQSVLVAAPHISQEKYWKACCLKTKNGNMSSNALRLQNHGFSYKIAYLQRWLQKLVSNCENYEKERTKLIHAAKVLSPWIFTIEIQVNAPDLNLFEVVQCLYNLISLKVRCAEGKNLDYKKKIIGMKFTQARDLGESLKGSQSLLSLNLSGNLIDDELFKFISPGLTLNTTLVQLNLSHNKLGDQGARRIAKILMKNQIITHLNLSNNEIAFQGSRFLASALKINSVLEVLNLKLNSIDDKAGAKFFKDLTLNTSLKVLDLEANQLSTMSVRKIALYLQAPNSLKEIYIANNNFLETDFAVIEDSLPSEGAKEYFRKNKYMSIKIV